MEGGGVTYNSNEVSQGGVVVQAGDPEDPSLSQEKWGRTGGGITGKY